MGNFNLIRFGALTAYIAFLIPSNSAQADSDAQARRLFNRIAGYSLPSSDPRLSQMKTLISQGRALEAAKIASSDDQFLNITVRQFAAPLSNRAETTRVPLNDFIAMFIGATRDGLDSRRLLYDNFLYVGNYGDAAFRAACTSVACNYTPNPNNGVTTARDLLHFTEMDRLGMNLAKSLVRIEPQRPDLAKPAGVFTTYAWSTAHYNMGTNRRSFEYAFREFMCTSIQEMADFSIPDDRVRQDVDRAPGGDATTFQNVCLGCHAGMDAGAGAFAFLDNLEKIEGTTVQKKYLQNNTIFPNGYVTRDDTWEMRFTKNQNAEFQFRTPLSGKGPAEFGKLIANSVGFSRCMAERAFTRVCSRKPHSTEKPVIETLKDKFEASNYNLKSLFEAAAITPACLGN